MNNINININNIIHMYVLVTGRRLVVREKAEGREREKGEKRKEKRD